VLLAGCDRVFGLGDPYEDARAAGSDAEMRPADGAIDAPADATDKIPQPLLHYRFDGDLHDANGGASATCTNSGGGGCAFETGVYGMAVTFDGSSIGEITLPSLPPSFTLMAWVSQGNGPVLDLTKVLSTTMPVYGLALSNGVSFYSYSGTMLQQTTAFQPTDKWMHLAVTYDGTTQTLYVDQIAQASTAVHAITYGANHVMCLGCRMNASTTYFTGAIDDVYIFDSVLTMPEIAAYASSAR
jgi:hypothetical protein